MYIWTDNEGTTVNVSKQPKQKSEQKWFQSKFSVLSECELIKVFRLEIIYPFKYVNCLTCSTESQ